MRGGQRLHELNAIEARHDDVAYEYVDLGGPHPVERLEAVQRLEHEKALLVQGAGHESAYGGLVVDDENAMRPGEGFGHDKPWLKVEWTEM